jgi:hypothetical protein
MSGDQFEGGLMRGGPTIDWEKTPPGVRYNLIKELPNGKVGNSFSAFDRLSLETKTLYH